MFDYRVLTCQAVLLGSFDCPLVTVLLVRLALVKDGKVYYRILSAKVADDKGDHPGGDSSTESGSLVFEDGSHQRMLQELFHEN